MTIAANKLVGFTLEALAELNIPIQAIDERRYLLKVPPEHRAALECGEHLPITFDKECFQQAEDSSLEFITPGSPVLGWLIEQIRKKGSLAQAARDESGRDFTILVQQVASRFQVDGGRVEAAGLRLVDSFLVQFEYLLRLTAVETRERLLRLLIDEEGKVLSKEESQAARLDVLTDRQGAPSLPVEVLARLLEAAEKRLAEISSREEAELAAQMSAKRRAEEDQLRTYFGRMREDLQGLLDISRAANERAALEEQIRSVDDQLARRVAEVDERYRVSSEIRPVGALVVTSKILEGTIVFMGGEARASLPVRLPIYAPEPPPYLCPKTGNPTYHVAATSDGRFIDAPYLAVCSESGKHLPKDELVACAATGKLYCPEFMRECPITLKPVHRGSFYPCQECRQRVSTLAIAGGVCRACKTRASVSDSDGRVRRIVARYPRLASWGTWRLSETRDIYCLELHGALSLARMVINKSDLGIVHCEKRNRFLGAWKIVPKEEIV